jgi:hypothetical protein
VWNNNELQVNKLNEWPSCKNDVRHWNYNSRIFESNGNQNRSYHLTVFIRPLLSFFLFVWCGYRKHDRNAWQRESDEATAARLTSADQATEEMVAVNTRLNDELKLRIRDNEDLVEQLRMAREVSTSVLWAFVNLISSTHPSSSHRLVQNR